MDQEFSGLKIPSRIAWVSTVRVPSNSVYPPISPLKIIDLSRSGLVWQDETGFFSVTTWHVKNLLKQIGRAGGMAKHPWRESLTYLHKPLHHQNNH